MKKLCRVLMLILGLFLLNDLIEIICLYFEDRLLLRKRVEETLDKKKRASEDTPEIQMDRRENFVEAMFIKYGARPVFTRNQLKLGHRTTFRSGGNYYRVGDSEIDGKPFLVISAIDNAEYADTGLMEEIAAFPWTLSDDRLEREVRRVLEVEEYPENYPDYEVRG